MVGLGPAGWSLLRELLSGAFSVAPSAPPFLLSAFFLAGSFASSLPVAPVAPDGSESWAWFSSAAPVQTGFAGVRSEGSDGPALNDAVPRGICVHDQEHSLSG
jgi:hypothetical protein